MAILNWIKYGPIKIGTLKLQLLRVPDTSLFGLGLKNWYPCVLDSFNLDLSGNTAINHLNHLNMCY